MRLIIFLEQLIKLIKLIYQTILVIYCRAHNNNVLQCSAATNPT